ncbi:MAG: hypothetical protein EVA98_02130 [SAR86 cluster bacterium]|uniref:Outer membrane lipoprotein carrier protein LolA n=1 Tax=SAR86 cluster bacterium TaxID=2030880 RepID=A0A520MRV2_9GAMM|nr:MAG: hypothetical protein EVA98_02130 [SAR86 cluster bacterium]
MITKFFLILTFNFSVFAVASSSSSDLLNNELKKNYSFVERSLNQSDLKIETSTGKIFFDKTGVTVNVLTPFEENYRVEDGKLEIHDVFLDQKQIIDINNIDNFFLNILIDGIDDSAKGYSINQIDDSTLQIISTNRSDLITFSFIENKLNLIRYKDSIGVEHGIELTPL